MATRAPITTIHHGMVTGRLNASSTPVTAAERLFTVSGPRTRKRWIRYSNATQLVTASAVTQSAFAPNTHTDTASAGSSASNTSRMIERVDCRACT